MDFTKFNIEKRKREILRGSDATIWNFLKQDQKKEKGSSKRFTSATLALRDHVVQVF